MRKMRKSIVTAGLAVFAASAIVTTAPAKDKVYRIGVCEQTQHSAISLATKGFEEALTEKLGDRVEFEVENAAGEAANNTLIINNFISKNVDLILANGTNALQAAASGTAEIPILGTSTTDYAAALDLDAWNGTVGTNISGTSDCAPLSEQADMILELLPEARSIGLLYCSAEPNSIYQAEVIRECLEEAGCEAEIKTYTFTDSNDIALVVTGAAENCDVLYIPTDNTAASNAQIIENLCAPAGVPVITGEENTCRSCGIATLTIDYYDLGYATGEMAYQILEEGADITAMAVAYAPAVTKKYVPERCAALGIAIPEGYEALEEDDA